MDLIITSDTSIAHLAGALGPTTWVVLKGVPDWRWFLKSIRTPWYKNMKLFRQKNINYWEDVFNDIYNELNKILN